MTCSPAQSPPQTAFFQYSFQYSVLYHFYSFCLLILYNCILHMFFHSSSVPGTPENLTALNTSTQQIRVMWDPPSSPNGILQGYKLTYEATKPRGLAVNVTTSTVAETAEELEGLLEGVTYRITVAAVNDVGEGDAVETEQATTSASKSSPSESLPDAQIHHHSVPIATLDCYSTLDPQQLRILHMICCHEVCPVWGLQPIRTVTVCSLHSICAYSSTVNISDEAH